MVTHATLYMTIKPWLVDEQKHSALVESWIVLFNVSVNFDHGHTSQVTHGHRTEAYNSIYEYIHSALFTTGAKLHSAFQRA